MNNTKTFSSISPNIIFYNDAIEEIESLIKNRRALLVSSEGFVKRGLVHRLEMLSPNIITKFTNVTSHPEIKDLEKSYKHIHQNEYEVLVAVGGGSVIDSAKYFSIYNEEKNASFVTKITKGLIPKKDYKHIPIIAIPTTAGTSSEITPWATIWDMDEKKKYSLHLPELFSEAVIYDPKLTLSLPKSLTIQTGLDVLSHALESIWNKNANSYSVDHAIKAAKLVIEFLPKLANDLQNLDYREKMLRACMYSGMAFSITQTALAHAMSYYITAYKGVPHGIACSFTLPMLMDKIIGEYDYIDNAFKEIFSELSSQKLRILMKKLDVSTEFSAYGIDAEEFIDLKKSLENVSRASNSLVIL